MRILSLLVIACLTLGSAGAQTLSLRWELLSNYYQGKRQAHCVLVLSNTGKEALPATGWALYFNGSSAPRVGETP
ncbi:MAG TPA: hypothetical protein VL547_14110, partial [Dinghuibacter sp.]|uniref:hypothetical protein n=1 Tax=Dinghuibacter sp. TaxID=2024697 RepID=UPI002C6A551C